MSQEMGGKMQQLIYITWRKKRLLGSVSNQNFNQLKVFAIIKYFVAVPATCIKGEMILS